MTFLIILIKVRGASNPPQYSNSNPAQLPIVQSQDVPPIYNKSAQQHQPPDQVLVSTSELQVISYLFDSH